MLLRSLTAGKISGTGTVTVPSRLVGAILVSTDGTNAAAIVLRKENASGAIIFDLSSKTPGFFGPFPLESGNTSTLYHDISGTGASAQLYEYVP